MTDPEITALAELPARLMRGELVGQTKYAETCATALRALLSERDVMRGALEPFANLGVTSGPDDEPCSIPYRITRGSIRKARQALSALTPKEPEQ